MPMVGMLLFALQISCAVHAVKTGRDSRWLYFILLFPGVGCAVYFVAELFPDLRSSRSVYSTAARLAKAVDPSRELRRLREQVDICDSVQNRVALAEEYMRCGLYQEAMPLYVQSFEGAYKDDSSLLYGLARAHFGNGASAEAKDALTRLLAQQPELRYKDAHVLLARCLERLGETDTALQEYGVLAERFHGEEARCRYALLLRKLGETEKARDIFTQIVKRSARGSRYARMLQKEWVQIAREHLA